MLKLIPASLLVFCTALCAEPKPLRFAINDSWAMPMVRIENGRAVEGILVDLQQRLAEKVGRSAQLVVLAHKRAEGALNAGDIDVRCYVSPNWMNASQQHFIWTRPFMTQRDVLISYKPGATLAEDMFKERVGTVLGFTYPRLEPLFESDQVQREDARTQDQVLLKLSVERYNYAISNERSLNWFNRRRPPGKQLYVHSELSSAPVACIIRNDPDVPTNELLRAMDQMADEGEFERILERYQ